MTKKIHKIFIDCGGYDGCSVRRFRKLYDTNEEHHIYTFEPNPVFFERYKNFNNHTLITKACYVKNENMNFNLDTKDFDGSSLLEKDNIKKYNSSIMVESIDFVEWYIELIEKLKFNCIITLKMDIEGAEYPVLEKLLQIDENYIKCISKIFIEWHWSKLSDKIYYKNKHVEITKKINDFKIPVSHWNAISN